MVFERAVLQVKGACEEGVPSGGKLPFAVGLEDGNTFILRTVRIDTIASYLMRMSHFQPFEV